MTNKKEQAPATDVLTTSEAFITKNKKPLIIISTAIIVILVGVFCYKYFIGQPREEKADTALAMATQYFEQATQYFEQGSFDKALNGDGATTTGFVRIASDYSGTDAANLANLYAGLCYANLNKWDKAVEYLDNYSTSDDALVSPAALAALGNAYAHVNQLDKAVSYLKKAAKKADAEGHNGVNNSLSPVFMLQAAEIVESQGKADEALEMYKDIKEKYVASQLVQSQEIDKYIERAQDK